MQPSAQHAEPVAHSDAQISRSHEQLLTNPLTFLPETSSHSQQLLAVDLRKREEFASVLWWASLAALLPGTAKWYLWSFWAALVLSLVTIPYISVNGFATDMRAHGNDAAGIGYAIWNVCFVLLAMYSHVRLQKVFNPKIKLTTDETGVEKIQHGHLARVYMAVLADNAAAFDGMVDNDAKPGRFKPYAVKGAFQIALKVCSPALVVNYGYFLIWIPWYMENFQEHPAGTLAYMAAYSLSLPACTLVYMLLLAVMYLMTHLVMEKAKHVASQITNPNQDWLENIEAAECTYIDDILDDLVDVQDHVLTAYTAAVAPLVTGTLAGCIAFTVSIIYAAKGWSEQIWLMGDQIRSEVFAGVVLLGAVMLLFLPARCSLARNRVRW